MEEKFQYGAIGSCDPQDCAACGGCPSENGIVTEHGTISLTMDDDSEVECSILTVFSVEDKEYIALLPLDENGENHNGEVYLYRFSQTENGDPMLANIEADEEYEAAGNMFNAIMEKALKEAQDQ